MGEKKERKKKNSVQLIPSSVLCSDTSYGHSLFPLILIASKWIVAPASVNIILCFLSFCSESLRFWILVGLHIYIVIIL